MTRTGSCYCGVVRYALDGDLGPIVHCHCRYCRRAHGAAFATVGMAQSAEFRITSGADAMREVSNPEGFRYFCARCGGRLFNRPRSTRKFLMLVIATLDEEPATRPAMHINVASKAGWYEIRDELPQHAAFPPAVTDAFGG
jgi:hypothetical protein